MAYASWSVVFGEQPTASKWNILGTNDAHFYSFLGDNLTWTSWTPTWVNLTVGNGTNSFKYTRVGNTILFKGLFTLGGTSSIGTGPTFTLPVTSVATLNALFPIATFIYDNNGGSGFNGYIGHASTTTGKLYTWDTNNNLAQVTATVPTAFGTNHKLHIQGFYEAA